MPATSPLIPCSQLPRTAGYDSCLDFATTGLGACDSLNMSAMAASGDDVFNCGCVALVGSGPAQAMAVAEIDRWERRQAVVQFSLAALSCVCGTAYLVAAASSRAKRLRRFPASLAYCMHLSDLVKSVPLCLVAALRLLHDTGAGHVHDTGAGHVHDEAAGSEPLAWVHTSSAECLCDAANAHPGCACRWGLLAFLLQARGRGADT